MCSVKIASKAQSVALSENRAQAGSSLLLMVLLILFIGSGVLQLISHGLSHQLAYYHAEKNYLQSFYQAQSGLHWGRALPWQQQLGWQCHTNQQQGFSCCLWRSSLDKGVLRGSSAQGQQVLWQWVRFSKQAPEQAQVSASGWSDRCPLSTQHCQPPLPGF